MVGSTFRGVKVLLLRQVDDFALASPDEDIAKAIYDIIGKRLTLPREDIDNRYTIDRLIYN